MNKLPDTWIACRLGDLFDYGRAEKAEPSQIGPDEWVLELEDIERDTSRVIQKISFGKRQSKSTKNRFRKGDVLYGKLRPYLNKVVRADEPGLCSTEIVPLSCPPGVSSDYLFYWLRSPQFLNYVNTVSHGLNMPRLGTDAGRNAPFILAPLAEQNRIAERLDSIFRRIGLCRDKLELIPERLEDIKSAALTLATCGDLTKDWRSDNSPAWRRVFLKDVATEFSYGSSAKSSVQGQIPVLRMGNIKAGELDWTDLVYTSDAGEIEKYSLVPGDVLFNRTNSPELVGKAAVYSGERPAIYAGYLIRVRCNELLLPEYLNYCLGSPMGRAYCWKVKSDGVSQSNINAKKLAAFQFDLPPVPEQIEIVRRVKLIMAQVASIEASWEAAKSEVEQLIPLLLSKAFQGELSERNSNDRPASLLLEEILGKRVERVSPPKKSTNLRVSEMKVVSESTLLEIIDQMGKKDFTFVELQSYSSMDYQSLVESLFGLLASGSGLEQYFDEVGNSMRLRRVKK